MASNQFPILRGPDAQQSRVQDNISGVLTSVAKALQNTPIMGAPGPAWILPSLLNGFLPFGAPFDAPAFTRDALGNVQVKGLLRHVAGVAANVNAFVLPPGYRPSASRLFVVRGTASTMQAAFVQPDGSVQFTIAVAAGGDASIEFSFLGEF